MDEKHQQSTQEKISISLSIQPQITLSDNGHLVVKGDASAETIQTLTDAAILKQKLFQEYQQQINASSDRTALMIGAMLAGLIGLSVFVIFNSKPQPQEVNSNAIQPIPVIFR